MISSICVASLLLLILFVTLCLCHCAACGDEQNDRPWRDQ